MYWKLQRLYAADDGANGGAGTEPPEGENKPEGEKEEPVFTPEQQAKIDALIDKAFAKGSAKATKEAEAKAAREKQTEAERLAADRAEFEAEKARLKAQAILTKEGYVLGEEETDSALIGLFALAPDAAEGNLAALKKLIAEKVNQEVDKRLKGAGQPKPQSGDKGATVGDTINGLFRRTNNQN